MGLWFVTANRVLLENNYILTWFLGFQVKKWPNVAESLNYAQKEQDDLKERMSLCENELSAQVDEISKQSVYSRRWNLFFYRIHRLLKMS